MLRELHVHVEEPSMEAFLDALLPRFVVDREIPFKIINHGSKRQLLKALPKRLKGYSNYPSGYRPKVLVLVDRDAQDCIELKQTLEQACRDANLATKSAPAPDGSFEVVNRIVIEELEAWYFGDIPRLADAYPGVPANLSKKQKFRDPDAIPGGTHEQLLKVLQNAGHYKGLDRLPKIEAARRMGALIEPDQNCSPSFLHFISGLRALQV